MPKVMGSTLTQEELEFEQNGFMAGIPANTLKIKEDEEGTCVMLNGQIIYHVDPAIKIDAGKFEGGIGAPVTMTFYAKVEAE